MDRNIEKDKDGNAVLPSTLEDKILGEPVSLFEYSLQISFVPYMPSFDLPSTWALSLGESSTSLPSRFLRLSLFAFQGFVVFLSKYLQIQFGVPQHVIQKFIGKQLRKETILYVSAISAIVGFAFGVMVGSVAMRILKLQVEKFQFDRIRDGERRYGWQFAR